jgi:hypothetical protein
MWGLYIRWPNGSFVLMEKGTEKYVRYLANYIEDEGTDPDDIRVSEIV